MLGNLPICHGLCTFAFLLNDTFSKNPNMLGNHLNIAIEFITFAFFCEVFKEHAKESIYYHIC